MSEETRIANPAPGPDLTEMLRGDQRLRWHQGQRVPVEAYFEHYPQIRDDPGALRELILGEMYLRRELGASFDLAEMRRRFPAQDAWLTEQYVRLKPSESVEDTSHDDDHPAAPANWPVLPGYQIIEELGRGGMGVVYKARQHRLNRVVALKMLLAGPSASARTRSRFRQEADAVAQLQHPYIVQIFDVIEEDGQLYLALEFVGGGSLARKIRGVPQPPQAAAECIRKLAQAMQFAHERGILHRDLKPSNILLTEDGIPKITDFGLAKRLDDDTSRTQTGTVLGTPDYMPPEQAEGKVHELGPTSDVYSLGSILYEMLTGFPPFHGEALVRVLDAVRFKRPAPPRHLQPGVPRDLEAICLKCLEKSPSLRYPTAQALADDLGRFLGERPVQARGGLWAKLGDWLKRRS